MSDFTCLTFRREPAVLYQGLYLKFCLKQLLCDAKGHLYFHCFINLISYLSFLHNPDCSKLTFGLLIGKSPIWSCQKLNQLVVFSKFERIQSFISLSTTIFLLLWSMPQLCRIWCHKQMEVWLWFKTLSGSRIDLLLIRTAQMLSAIATAYS